MDAPPPWDSDPDVTETTKDLALARYTEQLKAHRAGRERDEAALTLLAKTEDELFRDLHVKMREVAAQQADRNQTLGELVQKSAGAIVTLYTGLLALVFAADGEPLPARGLVPAIFLGASILLSTAYVAFLTRPPKSLFTSDSSKRANAWAQTRGFVAWTNASTYQRANFLRASIVALGVGLGLLPLPFLSIDTSPANGGQAAVLPAWPTVEEAADPSLAATFHEIVFQAQVDEVFADRAKAKGAAAGETVGSGFDDTSLALLFVGFVVVGLALIWNVGRAARQPEDRSGAGTEPES